MRNTDIDLRLQYWPMRLLQRTSLADDLSIRVAGLPEVQRFQIAQGDDGTVVQLHFDGFETVLDGLGEDKFFLGAWHV